MSTEAFLIELTELSKKHGIVIGGCGCCGSPWLLAKDALPEGGYTAYNKDTKAQDGMLQWVSPDDEYDWKEYSKYIVVQTGIVK